MSLVKVSVLLCCVVLPATASAQSFPSDPAYLPLHCDTAPMRDLFADQAGALDERDIVGDTGAPAGLRAADDTYLFLRMRLDDDPAPAGVVAPFAWGMQFDLDGDLTTYEVMVLADGLAGTAGTVSLFHNTATTLRNDLNDPPDLPAVATYPFSSNARTVVAAGSSYGGNGDFFLEIAVPWSALESLGLRRDTTTYVWAATSSTANGLNGDVACHDGASGPASLDVTASDETTGDPTLDPDGGGGGGGPGRLEGGGGCTAGAGVRAGASSPAALALALLALRRRRQTRRGAIDRSA
jgi:hypothetical protein